MSISLHIALFMYNIFSQYIYILFKFSKTCNLLKCIDFRKILHGHFIYFKFYKSNENDNMHEYNFSLH